MFMPFKLGRWTKGVTLLSEPDLIPDDALRIGSNVRLDRTLGAIEVRPGWTARTTTAFASSIAYLTRLFARAATYGYVHVASDLRRTNSTWGGDTSIAVYTLPMTSVTVRSAIR